jgi:acyl-CoA thioester hydrolase
LALPSFVHRLDVRFRDCDPMGHVNNAVYLTYLEQARFAHWRSIWKYRQPGSDPRVPGVILARAEVDYRAQAREGDVLDVRLFVAKIGRTSFQYEYEIVDQAGAVIVQAKTVQVMYDYAAGKPVEIAPDIRAMLHEAATAAPQP